MGTEFEIADQLSIVNPVYRKGGYDLEIDGRHVRASLRQKGEGAYELDLDGEIHPLWIERHGDDLFVHHAGHAHHVVAVNSLERASREADAKTGGGSISAPMPGVIVDVAVVVGAEVSRGDLMLTIESMKLQTAIVSPRDGRVEEILFASGQSFEKGAVLVRLAAPADPKEEASS